MSSCFDIRTFFSQNKNGRRPLQRPILAVLFGSFGPKLKARACGDMEAIMWCVQLCTDWARVYWFPTLSSSKDLQLLRSDGRNFAQTSLHEAYTIRQHKTGRIFYPSCQPDHEPRVPGPGCSTKMLSTVSSDMALHWPASSVSPCEREACQCDGLHIMATDV